MDIVAKFGSTMEMEARLLFVGEGMLHRQDLYLVM
jgi:hypothetical protein